MIAGCYCLQLYCDHPDHVHYIHRYWGSQYTGRIESEALTEARKDGWKFTGKGPDRKAFCPHHQ